MKITIPCFIATCILPNHDLINMNKTNEEKCVHHPCLGYLSKLFNNAYQNILHLLYSGDKIIGNEELFNFVL